MRGSSAGGSVSRFGVFCLPRGQSKSSPVRSGIWEAGSSRPGLALTDYRQSGSECVLNLDDAMPHARSWCLCLSQMTQPLQPLWLGVPARYRRGSD
jgi:hypothetical protein